VRNREDGRGVGAGCGVVLVAVWARVNLNPAIWEAIAATGWSSLRVKQLPTPK
jgi:hypothetical protein